MLGFTDIPFQIVLQHCDRGNLLKWIYENSHASNQTLAKICTQICFGLDYLHERKTLHLNLKLQNIVFIKKTNIIQTKINIKKTKIEIAF